MNFKSLAPVGFSISNSRYCATFGYFHSCFNFLMVLSGVIAIYTNLDIFDDIERDK